MSVLHYSDPVTGKWFREIKYTSYKKLDELKAAYEAKGNRTWLNNWMGDIWVLTVAL